MSFEAENQDIKSSTCINGGGSSIPGCYQSATWRNTLPKDESTQQVGIGFDLPDGEIIRLSLSFDSAKDLADTLLQFLCTDHSPNSSGMPSDDVSMPFDGENV